MDDIEESWGQERAASAIVQERGGALWQHGAQNLQGHGQWGGRRGEGGVGEGERLHGRFDEVIDGPEKSGTDGFFDNPFLIGRKSNGHRPTP